MIPYTSAAVHLQALLREDPFPDDQADPLVEQIVQSGGLPWLVHREAEGGPPLFSSLVSFHMAQRTWKEDTDLLALAFYERSPNRADPRVIQNLCTCIQRNRIRQRPWQIGEHPVFRELLLAALEGEPQVLDGLLNLLEALPGLLPPSLLKTVLGKLRELARDPNNGLDPVRLESLG